MSQIESGTNEQTITECYQCHNFIPSSKFICHVRQCCSTKRSRENPDVDNDQMPWVDADNVFLPDDESEESSLDLTEGLHSGLFGDPYLESLMLDSIHHLEPPTAGSTFPELEIDDNNADDMMVDDHWT